MTQLPPAGWYPEQSSPTGQRYWDGTAWTHHVAPPSGQAPPAEPAAEPAAGSAAGPAPGPAPTADWMQAAMITAPGVQIEQRGRVMESSSVYLLTDADGAGVGQAQQVGQGRGGRLVKAMTDMDRNLAVTLQFTDPQGRPVMTLLKPGGVGPQRFRINDPSGGEIGQIQQKIRMVREAFDIIMNGHKVGTLASENWWDRRFSVLGPTGQVNAVVHKRYEGYARAAFTSADLYVVEYRAESTPRQRAMALASAIAMDIALYQR